MVRIVEKYRADKQNVTDSTKRLHTTPKVIGELSNLQDMDVSTYAWDYEEVKKQHLLQIIQAERNYEEQVSKTSRVQEDELQDLNLGSDEDPQMVKISVKVEGQFKQDLIGLLQEFKDIFAWHYTDMKGVDPRFCMHRINLKKDLVPIVS